MKTIKQSHLLHKKTYGYIDIVVRLFHWFIVILFSVLFITGYNIDGSDLLHTLAGYLLASIILSRIVWGFIGYYGALWESYLFHPKHIFSYMYKLFNSTNMEYRGHNPVGSSVILLMIALLLMVVVSGLLLQGLFEAEGIFAFLFSYFSDFQVIKIKSVHRLLAYAMLIVILFHLSGVIWSSFLYKINLPMLMISGKIHSIRTRKKL